MNEIDEMKAARSRIRELEAALADAHMDYCRESAFLDIACERLGGRNLFHILRSKLESAGVKVG
ncbi:MAG: hypothetical protein LBF80_00750, partial [Spirochaetaceae bacterium]|nr:hypothetical protein [Spirochaetaceae bacterium]